MPPTGTVGSGPVDTWGRVEMTGNTTQYFMNAKNDSLIVSSQALP